MSRNGNKNKVVSGMVQVSAGGKLAEKIRAQAERNFKSASQWMKDLAVAELVRVGALPGINGGETATLNLKAEPQNLK